MNGIIVVNKPSGITSRDVVNYISKLFNIKKVGHNGTLDPLASGVLVICLGRYTKLNSFLTSYEKEYVARVKIGVETDTLDITGNVLKEDDKKIDFNLSNETFKSFPKKYLQEVPKYSAVKVNGKKLYEYARENREVELPKREVEIKSLELLDSNSDSFTFKTLVSKGTYIRSLIRDILYSMNLIGSMESLTRTKQGIFKIEKSYSLKDIENGKYKLLKIKDILDIQTVKVDDLLKKKIVNGGFVYGDYDDIVLFVDSSDAELAIYKKCDNVYKPEVML